MSAAVRRVPVIALTGHLGAGKTTVLNRLLRTPGARLGVVVNDFGSINVDAGLVSGQIDQVGSIAGGCVCCLEDVGELDAAFDKLARPELRLDAIVVEASGFAEPGPLARLIHYSEAAVRPAGLVDVVDAVEHFETVDTGGHPAVRFAVATLVVLNKCDLVSSERLERIEQRIREVNPSVQIVRTSHGAVDPALLLDVASHEDPPDQLPIGALLRQVAEEASEHGHEHRHARSVSVSADGPTDPGALLDLLDDPPAGAYRMKGVVRISSGRAMRAYAVHVVGGRVDVLPAAHPTDGAGHLVAIGLDLDESEALQRITAALAPVERPDLEGLKRWRRRERLSR
ncbi:CobW family GTP-binding protein [Nocardioides acrostichi]|uniref:GTP-binding protein n=1 Tax=Nocardioides acrostichi TaxID=2784339 RepID=A0A930Y7N3_9ACTN|nr:GTP-binding protein [Nocardioides acrostichi]MBF4163610.1 GTP-binding protein [Nocardioides acrostichi]